MRLDDVHAIETSATPAAVWEALPTMLARAFDGARSPRIAAVLGCRERRAAGRLPEVGATIPGFRVAESVPARRLVLEGRHRFADYSLAFEVESTAGGSRIRAVTAASFPGLRGALYRAMLAVVHVPVTKRMLRKLARRAERLTRNRTPDRP